MIFANRLNICKRNRRYFLRLRRLFRPFRVPYCRTWRTNLLSTIRERVELSALKQYERSRPQLDTFSRC